jgi:KipI family sensor histidine kinase inhibitor
METTPQIVAASDRSALVVFGDRLEPDHHADVRRFATALARAAPPFVVDVHPAYASVLVVFDAAAIAPDGVQKALQDVLAASRRLDLPPGRLVDVPVAYGGVHGPDLPDVAARAGLSVERVIDLHSGADYRVDFIGFSPGFGYLRGLETRLATPRLATPRVRVPAGSVAIGGAQTAVYPTTSPGGWRLIGRTPRRLFRPEGVPPALLAMGDTVRFHRIDAAEFEHLSAPRYDEAPAAAAPPAGRVRVEAPGLLTTVQDGGRRGCAHLGIAPSGAADGVALQLGNRLVGNAPDAAALEMSVVGGRFAFEIDAVVAVTGADFGARRGGQSLPMWRAVRVAAGERLDFGPARNGARAYLCVRGGFVVPGLLGSASTHLRFGLGGLRGRRLEGGDRLAIGPPAGDPVPGILDPQALRALYADGPLRVTPGPQLDWFAADTLARLAAADYIVSETSDRMGLRLDGPPLGRAAAGELLTEGVSAGALQVPEDGRPILLGVDHPTTGGYPKPAHACSADLHRIGQLRPRDRVRFAAVTLDEARRLARERAAAIAGAGRW